MIILIVIARNEKYRLGGGAFQEICYALLFCKGYERILAYDMRVGIVKTKKGNSDTYFKSKTRKYIIVDISIENQHLLWYIYFYRRFSRFKRKLL